MNISENLTESDEFISVTVSDLESQREETEVVLKSILKHEVQVSEDDAAFMVLRSIYSIFVLIVTIPIVLTELYFGFSNMSCLKSKPDGVDMSIKSYLLVSGFVSIQAIILYIYSIWSLKKEELRHFFRLLIVFHIFWNLVGVILFWESIYTNCNKNMTTYIFISLFIKYFGDAVSLIKTS